VIPRSADVLCCADRDAVIAARDETSALVEWRTDLLGAWDAALLPPERTLLALRLGPEGALPELPTGAEPALLDLDLTLSRAQPDLAQGVAARGGFLSSHRLGASPDPRLVLAERVAGASKLAFESGPALPPVPPQSFLSPMGRFGEVHRVRDAALGRPRLRYLRRLEDGGTAIGQPAWEELPAVAPTALSALLGREIGGSLSPTLHNHWGLRFGRGLVRLPNTPPAEALALANELEIDGFAVTSPYKRQALEVADEASDLARRVGAANTLVRLAGGGWRAENTDVVGARASLKLFLPGGGDLRVVGAGGAAAAVVVAAQELGLTPRIFTRHPERYGSLSGVPVAPLSALLQGPAPDLVVQATPAPLGELRLPDAPLWDLRIRPDGLPEGARDGSLMLVVQGGAQRRLWYGEQPGVAQGMGALSAALRGVRPSISPV